MRLQCLQYKNFRNHRFLTFTPVDGITIIYGKNGSGKTSLLEGVHYCALTKGFVGATDSECLSFSSDYFLLDGSFRSDLEAPLTVKVLYKKEKEKQIIVNNSEIKPFSHHIGRIPCITFSPSEMVIVNGSPSERRRFIDNAISQTNRRYLDDLLAYRRVLMQRNALLVQLCEKKNVHKDMLSVWTEQLSKHAASIVYERAQFITAFNERFRELYGQFSFDEEPAITYRCSLGNIIKESSLDLLYSMFLEKYEMTERQEIYRAQTLTGPHRDDLLFLLNDKEIKKYASQGQLRTFLIGLKLTQHQFFFELIGEKPICLLDDIFSELDTSRIADIFTLLETFGQTIITSTEKMGQSNVTALSIESLRKTGEE
ncbi:MAG: DNA replication and repair protein RecF [Verrucomicrobiota bacterium]